MADTAFFDTPDWFTAAPEIQAATLQQRFDAGIGQSEQYLQTDEVGKANMRLAYQALVEERAEKSAHNPRAKATADAQLFTNVSDFGTTTGQTVVRSMDQGKDVLLMAPEILSGNFGEGFGRNSATYYQKIADAPQTASRKEIDADIAKWRKSYDHAGDWAGKASAWGQLAADIITNPAGAIEFGAESSSSLAAYWAGAKVGGAAAAGVTAATAGAGAAAAPFITAGGMWASASAQATSMKFLEKLQEGMQAEKIEMTPGNIQLFVKNNPEAVAAWREESMMYGSAMGAVDVAFGAVASRFTSAPVRAAQRMAAAAAKADSGLAARLTPFIKPGHSLEDLTKDYITGEAQKILAAQTFKSKLGRKAGSYVGELLSEPASEASGLLASGEEIKAEDLIAETIGGIGMGPIGAAINTGALGTKLAKNVTGEFKRNLFGGGKKEVDPNDPIAVAKRQNMSPTDVKFKEDVKATDVNAPEVATWADPKDKATYDPVKAATILADKGDDHATLSRIKTIENDLLTDIFAGEKEQIKKSAEFAKLKEAGLEKSAQGVALAEEMTAIVELRKQQLETFNQVNQKSQALTAKLQEAGKQKTVTPVDLATVTTPEVTKHIIESLGSGDLTNQMTPEQLENAKALPDATPESKALIDLTIKGRILKKNIQDSAMSGKDADEVAKDVFHGLAKSQFKGIDSYLSAISTAVDLQHNSVVKAELGYLTRFRNEHKQKHEDTKALFEIFKKDGDEVEEDARYINLKAKNSNFFVNSRTQKLLAMEAMEVEALDNAVAHANALVAASKVSTETTTAPKTPEAPVANPPAPAAPPAANVPKEVAGLSKNDRETYDDLVALLAGGGTVHESGKGVTYTDKNGKKFTKFTFPKLVALAAKTVAAPTVEVPTVETPVVEEPAAATLAPVAIPPVTEEISIKPEPATHEETYIKQAENGQTVIREDLSFPLEWRDDEVLANIPPSSILKEGNIMPSDELSRLCIGNANRMRKVLEKIYPKENVFVAVSRGKYAGKNSSDGKIEYRSNEHHFAVVKIGDQYFSFDMPQSKIFIVRWDLNKNKMLTSNFVPEMRLLTQESMSELSNNTTTTINLQPQSGAGFATRVELPVAEEHDAPTEEFDNAALEYDDAAIESLLNDDDQYIEEELDSDSDDYIDPDEIIDSTEADSADNLAGIDGAYDSLNVTYNDAIDGKVSENYRTAKEKLKLEIKECESILRCFKGK